MGSINYGTSDYITMGIEPESRWDYEHDPEIMDEMKAYAAEYNMTIDEAIDDCIQINAEADRANAECVFNKYSFHYYHITIESGYYEGFYFNIENNFPVAYEDYRERKEALAEIRDIEKMLIELAGNGVKSVYPGWGTTYHDYKTTLKHIKKATQEMRQEVRDTPTWRQYERRQAV